jgi:hypothetical protein
MSEQEKAKQINIRMPVDIYDKIAAERGESTLTAYIMQALEAYWCKPEVKEITPETPPPPSFATREEAAEALLPFLEPTQRALLLQMCQEHNRHPADYLLSYIELIREQGSTSYYMGDARTKRQATVSSIGSGLEPVPCEQCQETFTPVRFGQRFCSNPCGHAHNEQVKREALEDQGTYNPLVQDNSDIVPSVPPSVDTVALRNALVGNREVPEEELTLS